MGTSQSSGGPPPGVPMVPPWVPDPPDYESPPDDEPPPDGELPPDGSPSPEEDDAADGPADQPATSNVGVQSPPIPIAPLRRFGGARQSLGSFARTGEASNLRRGLGHYIRSGYGGSGTAARRFGGTASTAGALYGALSAVAAGQPAAPGSPLDPALLSGRSAREIMDAVGEAVRPVDGTQDTEAARASIREALSDLLTRFPNADLINLNDEQRVFAVERYVALDVFRRFALDLGKTIQEKAPTAVAALSRLKQVREYAKETVAAAFRKLRAAGRTITTGRVGRLVRDALRETFEVFEGYAE